MRIDFLNSEMSIHWIFFHELILLRKGMDKNSPATQLASDRVSRALVPSDVIRMCWYRSSKNQIPRWD